jgi:hypothetical protein
LEHEQRDWDGICCAIFLWACCWRTLWMPIGGNLKFCLFCDLNCLRSWLLSFRLKMNLHHHLGWNQYFAFAYEWFRRLQVLGLNGDKCTYQLGTLAAWTLYIYIYIFQSTKSWEGNF